MYYLNKLFYYFYIINIKSIYNMHYQDMFVSYFNRKVFSIKKYL